MRRGKYNWLGLGVTSASAVMALEPSEMLLIQKGPMVLKPQLELKQTFNDNITYREEDKESDFVTTVSPGLGVQFGSQTFNYVDFTYFYDQVNYWEHDDLSANQHRANMVMRFEKSRFLLEGFDEVKRLASPLGGGITFGGRKIERTTWLDQYKLTYDLSEKTAVYLEALHTTTDYKSGERLYDSFTLTGTLGFEFKAFSRTAFFGEVYYGMTENDPNAPQMVPYPTARFVGAFLGARGNLTEQLTGMVKAGYEHRTYSGDQGSSGAPVVALSLTERFWEGTILTLTYNRSQRESVQFARNTYTSDSVTLDLLQHIAEEGRLRGNLLATYLSADYETSGGLQTGSRQDHLIAAGLTITYDIKLWLHAFGSYEFEYLESNLANDYRVNRFTVGLQLGY